MADDTVITDTELYALVGMSSASATMFERRRRILKEAQRLLSETGIAGFSTMELSRRSGVAQRTIYNAFGSRDALLALVIRFYFEQFSRAIETRFDSRELDGALGRLAATTLRNIQLRNYMSAIISLHFSPTAPANVRAVTAAIGESFLLPWLHGLDGSRSIPPGLEILKVARALSNAQYAVVQDWLTGTVTAREVLPDTLGAVLAILGGVVRGRVRAELDERLADLRQDGPWIRGLRARAQAEVSALFPDRGPAPTA